MRPSVACESNHAFDCFAPKPFPHWPKNAAALIKPAPFWIKYVAFLAQTQKTIRRNHGTRFKQGAKKPAQAKSSDIRAWQPRLREPANLDFASGAVPHQNSDLGAEGCESLSTSTF